LNAFGLMLIDVCRILVLCTGQMLNIWIWFGVHLHIIRSRIFRTIS
jgi:hypothetical protein